MSRSKSKASRERLFRRVHRHRVKYITVLPSLITLLNGVFGFTAIVFASRGADKGIAGFSYFSMAGYMILLAMVADMLDGRLARMSQSTSSFGGQLDSLCDLISFGVAPAFLMLKVIETRLELVTPFSGNLFNRFIWLAALAYVSCATIRLARFNVENEENEASHMSFAGLPTPAAAGAVTSLIIFHQEMVSDMEWLIFLLPFLALSTAALMVSRIRYPHVLNVYLKGKKPFSYLTRVLLFLGLVVWWRLQPALMVIFVVFAFSGVARWLYIRALREKKRLFSKDHELEANPSGEVGS